MEELKLKLRSIVWKRIQEGECEEKNTRERIVVWEVEWQQTELHTGRVFFERRMTGVRCSNG